MFFFSLSNTFIQNCSNWHVIFVFVFLFITFYSRCGMEWDRACRPTNDPFGAFNLSSGAQEPGQPQTIFVQFKQLKKKIFWAFIQKKRSYRPPSTALVLLYKFETSWALLGRLSRGVVVVVVVVFFFFANSGPLILNIPFS